MTLSRLIPGLPLVGLPLRTLLFTHAERAMLYTAGEALAVALGDLEVRAECVQQQPEEPDEPERGEYASFHGPNGPGGPRVLFTIERVDEPGARFVKRDAAGRVAHRGSNLRVMLGPLANWERLLPPPIDA